MAGSSRTGWLHLGYRVRDGAGGTGEGRPVQELPPFASVVSGVPNGGQWIPFASQRRRTDVRKAFIVVAATSALTMSMALAQEPERPGAAPADSAKPASSQIVDAQGRDEWLASKLKGTTVVGSDNQKVGDVIDILLDKSGQVRAFIVGVGGVLGLGAKEVAIDLTEFREVPATNGNKTHLKVPMTKEQLAQAPDFKPLPLPPATTGSAPSGSPPRSPPR
jgi:sporulation protein YlmC with PRC-barrel domain